MQSVRLRGPTGQSTLSLEPTTPLSELRALVAANTGVAPHRQLISAGFPPVPLQVCALCPQSRSPPHRALCPGRWQRTQGHHTAMHTRQLIDGRGTETFHVQLMAPAHKPASAMTIELWMGAVASGWRRRRPASLRAAHRPRGRAGAAHPPHSLPSLCRPSRPLPVCLHGSPKSHSPIQPHLHPDAVQHRLSVPVGGIGGDGAARGRGGSARAGARCSRCCRRRTPATAAG